MEAVRRMLHKCNVGVPARAARVMDDCLYEGDYWWLGAGEDAAARKLLKRRDALCARGLTTLADAVAPTRGDRRTHGSSTSY